jgi:hypothetical protein
MKVKFLLFSFFLLPFNVAKADSVPYASETATLNWSAVSFSGPATPAPAGDFFAPGPNATIASATEQTNASLFTVAEDLTGSPGWGPTIASAQVTPGDYASATVSPSGLITVSSLNTSPFVGDARVDRAAYVTVTDGVLNISVPYSYSLSVNGSDKAMNCDTDPFFSCYVATAGVVLQVINAQSGQLLGTFSSPGPFLTANSGSSAISGNGELLLDAYVPDGVYWADISIIGVSQAANVPEPGTLALSGLGLLGLALIGICGSARRVDETVT